MKTLGNLIWLVFGGLQMALAWWLAGLLFCITIIGIPFAFAAFRIGLLTLWPFGREVVSDPQAQCSVIRLLANIVWAVLFGWELALGHLLLALLCFITIIGIPFGLQHLKLAGLSFIPLGKTVVPLSAV